MEPNTRQGVTLSDLLSLLRPYNHVFIERSTDPYELETVRKGTVQEFQTIKRVETCRDCKMELNNVTASDVSDYTSALFQYSRATIRVTSSVLREFFRYLYAEEILQTDLSGDVPRPKIYAEEDILETWTPDEIRRLLAEISRNSAIGKRDYAMVLLAAVLEMRAGDICAMQFKNID